jgi:hypothetical protein
MLMKFAPKTNKQTNSVALSPQANYTDWVIATCSAKFGANFCTCIKLGMCLKALQCD